MTTLTDVAMSLSKQLLLTEENKGKNIVFSPASIHAMLCLIGAGANGSTLSEILLFLKFKSKDELSSFSSELSSLVLDDDDTFNRAPRLSFVNGIWCDKSLTLKTSFQHLVDDVYKATLKQVDFRTEAETVRDEVNSWAKMKTNGLIKEILPPNSITEYTRLILANALYFKAMWRCEFDPEYTREDDFHLLTGTSVKVPFMTTCWGENKMVSCFEDFKVLRLPYEQGRGDKRCFSTYIFLPDSKDGLQSLVEKSCSESGFLDRHLPREYVQVDKFRLPKFKVSHGFKACEVLQQLGLTLPFDPDEADLTEMTGDDLFVASMRHKSFIEFNEQGTEAAAVTEADEDMGCSLYSPPRGVDFVADHPFLFLIREDATESVLFIGYLLNPLLT